MKPKSDEARLLSMVLVPGFYRPAATILALVVAWAGVAYGYQLRYGLGVTGMRDRVPWGLYIVNFVFFIGISHAGTLISAILRLTGAEWRRPITRMAEVITAVALMTGAIMPIIDLGRADHIPFLAVRGRLQSPILWDLLSITTYLTGSLIYLYLPIIPDPARLRDHLGHQVGPVRRWFYRTFSLGWKDTPQQMHRLEKILGIMCIVIVPIAVSVHTVVSWIFSMTVRPGWHSSVFGPYFVIGAIFSGIAGIIVAMAAFRRMYRLEQFITKDHFVKLGWLLLTLNLLYIYFTFSEYLTVAYMSTPDDKILLAGLFTGNYAVPFWIFTFAGMVVPAFLVALPWTRTVAGITVASVLVNIGMWLKRFVIVVPSLTVPQMPYEYLGYQPTWVEWSIMAGAFSLFLLLYITFARYVPIISVWEVTEARGAEAPAAPRPLAAVGAGGGDDD